MKRWIAACLTIMGVWGMIGVGCVPAAFQSGVPTNDTLVECKGVIVNRNALTEDGVNSVPVRRIDNFAEPFRIADLAIGGNCSDAGETPFTSAADADAYWARFVAARLASLPMDDESGLAMYAGEWCESQVEPIVCVDTGDLVGGGVCASARTFPAGFAPPLSNEPLRACAELPGNDRVVSCGTPSCTEHCSELNFGDVAVGAGATRNIFVSSCDAGQIDVIVDGMIINPGPDGRSQFTVVPPTAPSTP